MLRSASTRSRATRLRGLAFCAAVLGAAGARAQSPPAASAMEADLGRQLFFDATLSEPAGQSCGSCHAPSAGFRFPDSQVNQKFGVAEGVVPGRFTSRSVPTINYAIFIPKGPPSAHLKLAAAPPGGELLFIGGMFWDGHADTLEHQATFPFQNANEMNNLVHGLGSPEMVVKKVEAGSSSVLFKRVFGPHIFGEPVHIVFADVCRAIAAYERTEELSPFTSKFDAYQLGRATLTPEELDGLRLFTGTVDGTSSGAPWVKNAQCTLCHGMEDKVTDGPSLFTRECYANIGTPRNEDNPFYDMTDPVSNPYGYNPLGEDFVDLGLGEVIYPLQGLPPGNMGPGSDGNGDYLAANGSPKVPTVRNVDKRPSPDFVKPYMHNGVFKSLKEVVHFYNTRNLTTVPGEIIDLSLPDPYAGLVGTPLWAPPEVYSPTALVNPQGVSGADGGMVGNLGLTDEEEDHLVAFMQALTDGYFPKNPHAAAFLEPYQGP
jgi:cytochrome c peroxidase